MNGSGIRATVLLCTYNDGGTVAAALDSALEQTASRAAYDVLVVDDGSTDGTPDLLADYRREGVEIVSHESNRGLAAACNTGLARIRAPFFVRLDGDDCCEPNMIEALLLPAHQGANLVYSDRWEQEPGRVRRLRTLAGELDISLLVASGVLLPTGLVQEIGGYRPLFWEEYDLYLRLLETGHCTTAHIPEPLYTYNLRASQMTADPVAVESGWTQLREIWPEEVLARYGIPEGPAGVPGRHAG